MYPTEVTSEETKRSVVQDVHRPDGLLIYAGLRVAVGSEQLTIEPSRKGLCLQWSTIG